MTKTGAGRQAHTHSWTSAGCWSRDESPASPVSQEPRPQDTVAQAMPEEDEQMTGVVFNSCALQGGRQQPALANTVRQPQVSNKRKEPRLVTW